MFARVTLIGDCCDSQCDRNLVSVEVFVRVALIGDCVDSQYDRDSLSKVSEC